MTEAGPSPRPPDDESAALLRAIVETAVDGILTIDEFGTISTVNPATERIFGYSANELIGQNVKILMPEPYRAEHDGYLERFKRTGERRIIGIGREVVGRRKDGSEFPLELSVAETRIGDRRIFTGIIRNVTERKRAEQALRGSEERLAGIIGSAMDAIITVNERQEIVVFNAAAEAMFQCTADEAIGQRLDRFIPQRFRHAHARHISEFGDTGVTSRSMWRPGVLLALRSDGEEFPIEASISQIESDGHKLFTVILRDVTERVRFVEELRAAKESAEAANRAKDQFIAVMSHELRTPLNAITGYVDLLLAEVFDPIAERQREALERVRHSAQHLVGVIEQVLQYARSDAGKQIPRPQTVNVHELLEGVAALVEHAAINKGLDLRCVLPGLDIEIETDPGMLRQIVLNLLSNAIAFTTEGSVELVGQVRDNNVVIQVSDTGVGIDSAEQSKIFDPFWQADQSFTRPVGGTGLGLSVVKRLVDALGGGIAVESEPGMGSKFTVHIPARGLAAGVEP